MNHAVIRTSCIVILPTVTLSESSFYKIENFIQIQFLFIQQGKYFAVHELSLFEKKNVA